MITIIISTLNCENLIEKTLISIQKQNIENLQVIIKDGLSKDKTLEIIKNFKTRSGYKINLISKKDSGIYDAWNQALKYVENNWIMFLGAGDEIIKDSLEKYLKYLNKELDVVYSKIFVVKESFKKEINQKQPNLKRYMNIPHPSVLHNISFLNDVGEFDKKLKIAGDYELLLRKKLNYKFCDFFSIKMLHGGISNSSIDVFNEVLRIQNKYFQNRKIQNYVNYIVSLTKFLIKKHLNVN